MTHDSDATIVRSSTPLNVDVTQPSRESLGKVFMSETFWGFADQSRMMRTGISNLKIVKAKEVTSVVVADFIVRFFNERSEAITNSKLQKLVFYSHAWFSAIYDRCLFREPFYAGSYGPFEYVSYARYKRFGSEPIPFPIDQWRLPTRTENHIREVLLSYGHFSAFELELIVCSETPWIDAVRLNNHREEYPLIAEKSIRDYYKAKGNGARSQST